ncbi:GNAT family N-acetyltransferase [Catellatospora paridis]|uniref:GNAT family N-acetyltransferase n=1 Tax=Catellatospora paridis TaxID=1617086 RepID=UPI0018AFB685|nr:GNAT family N-acetyltransferase [Catellatospora paridis]
MYTVRQAGPGDLAGVRAVARRFGNLGQWPHRPDYLDRELDNGRLTAGFADGVVVGFGATFARGGLTHLADLFVLPEHQSSGLGRTLLTRLLTVDAPRVTFASSDPRAVALYIRQGMRPICPLLYLRGPLGALPGPGAARPAGPGEEAGPDAVAAVAVLDADASGGRRDADLAWYAALPGVTTVHTGTGYAMVRDTRDGVQVGPAGGQTTRHCTDAVLAALARHRAAGTATLCLFGPNPLLPVLLEAGFTIADMDVFLSSGADPLALDRYLPHPDLG